MKRGQASFEYIAVIGLVLVLLIPLFYYSVHSSSEKIKISQAEDAVNSIVKASEEVYSLSPGTKKFVWVSIPGGVVSTSVDEAEITVAISVSGGTSDITSFSKATMTGEIPSAKGTYHIPIELLESGVVLIGRGNDSIIPSVVWTYPKSLTCNPITLRANTDEPTTCRFALANMSYNLMTDQMQGKSLGHSYDLGLQGEDTYTYYIRCIDSFSNVMNYSEVISYSINLTLCGEGMSNNESVPPVVELIDPESNYLSNSSRIIFYYNVTDLSPIFTCRLIVDDEVKNTVYSPDRDITNNITGDLDQGEYVWSINCTDAYNNIGNSSEREIEVNATLDEDLPRVALEAPVNGSFRNFNLVRFFYNVTDDTSGIHSCRLTTSGELDSGGTSSSTITDYSVEEDTSQSLSLSLDLGNWTWNVSCTDDSIYRNENVSLTNEIRINQSNNASFIDSCDSSCEYKGYSDGICRQNVPKCAQNYETHNPDGDQYCTGGDQSDTCCCKP